MSAPSLAVQVNGQGTVTGDQLNTYRQWCVNVAQLRSFIGVANMMVYIQGYTSALDGGQGDFYWNATGTAPDDGGITTVVPSGAAAGEWTRISSNVTSVSNSDGTINTSSTAGAVTLSLNLAHANTWTANQTFPGITVSNTVTTATVTASVSVITALLQGTTASGVPIVGSTNASNSPAGDVGEFISSSTTSTSGNVSMSSGTTANITNVSLTAGDWDVWGNVVFAGAGSTTINAITAGINTTSATLPIFPGNGAVQQVYPLNTGTGLTTCLSAGLTRINVSTPTTAYLVANTSFSNSTLNSYGFLGARRVR